MYPPCLAPIGVLTKTIYLVNERGINKAHPFFTRMVNKAVYKSLYCAPVKRWQQSPRITFTDAGDYGIPELFR